VAMYDKTGAVHKVTRVVEQTIAEPPASDQILVKMLAAPINPADFNMIEGVYSIKPSLPAVGGSEGVGEVLALGSNITDLQVGDWVIPAQPALGTWRSHLVCDRADMHKVANDIPAVSAATVAVNPCTAFRMLEDFVKLKEGDVVIQNGCNSGVGLAVVQLAKNRGIRTINILRDRPNYNEISERLQSLGADLVLSQSDVISRERKVMDMISALPAPVLGLNCVGGRSGTAIACLVADRAPLVTYGGMSRRPVSVPTGRLIFNDLQARGFWLSRWIDEHSAEERGEMIQALTDLMREGKLVSFTEERPFSEFPAALQRATEGFRDKKVVLTFD